MSPQVLNGAEEEIKLILSENPTTFSKIIQLPLANPGCELFKPPRDISK